MLERLGELLRAAGFGGRRSISLLGEGGGIVAPVQSLVALGREDDARVAALLKLFGYGHALERDQAQRVLAPLTLDALCEADLLEVDGPLVRSRLRLTDFQGLILASDPPGAFEGPAHVMGLSAASTLIAHLTVRRKIGTALDLGTGSGVQALLAARHADHVVGVDINPHALALAQTSERLNGMAGRVTWLQGSWLQPVRGERFDLVVANPPYVISPDNALQYRDSEAAGDELARKIVRECAGALAEGGFATVMCDWIHREGDWETPVRDWVAGLGCDALLLHHASHEPLAYAIGWHHGRADADSGAFDETVHRWLSHYLRSGIERIANGFVVLRRRAGGANWVQAFAGIGVPRGAGGAQLERMFAGGDFLHGGARAGGLGALLSGAWRLLEPHRLEHSAAYQNGAYVGEARMRPRPDSGVHATVDPRVLALLVACDGRRTLGELIDETVVPDDLDRDAFHGLCLSAVRDLIARGYLLGPS